MLAALLRLLGGRAFQQRDLRALFAALFLTDFGASAAFPLRMLYAQAHHATPVQLGLIAGVFFLAPILVQLPLGALVDRWGRVPVLLFGTITHVFVGIAFIVFNAPVELIVLRFVEGVCVAAVQPATYAYIADVTPAEHRAEAYGVQAAVINCGLLIGPLIGGIVGQNAGFAAVYIFCAVIEAIAVALVILRVREPARHVDIHAHAGPVVWRRLLSLPLLGVYFAFFSFQIVMGMFSSLWAIWMRDLGGSYFFIGLTFSVFALPQIFLGAFAGRASDRLGRGVVVLWAGLAISIVYATYGFVTSLALILVMGLIEGSILVFQQPAVQSLLAAASPADARGRAQGISGVAGSVGGAAAAFFSLPLYHQSHLAPFLISGSVMAAGSVAAALSAALLVRRSLPARSPAPVEDLCIQAS